MRDTPLGGGQPAALQGLPASREPSIADATVGQDALPHRRVGGPRSVRTGLQSNLAHNWLRASKRSVTADNGKSLGAPSPVVYSQERASGGQRPLKQCCLVPVCEHGHGGCDDSSGDTRLTRGLPFGSMPLLRPPAPDA